MTTETAARLAGRTAATIRTWCRYGAVKAAKVAGRWVIDAASLARRIALDTKEQPMQPALTKTLSDGRTATVTREGKIWAVAVNGQPYTSGDLHKRPDPRDQKATVWAIGAQKVLGLSDDEYATLKAVLDAEREAYRLSPRGQRAELVTTLEIAYDKEAAARAAVQDHEAPWGPVTAAEQEVEAAEAALDAFDAAHPDLTAEREAERAKAEAAALDRAFRD